MSWCDHRSEVAISAFAVVGVSRDIAGERFFIYFLFSTLSYFAVAL
jgi:hypothetical protein